MILFLFWSLQFTCAASGSWGDRLSFCAVPQAFSGGALTHSISYPLHCGTTLLVIRHVYAEERVTISPAHLENKH